MKVRDVIPAVEIIVDEDLPVAIDVVGAAIEVMQIADAEESDALGESAEKLGQGRGVIVEIDEDKTLPGFNANGNQAILGAVKILDAFKLGHALEGTIETIIPAAIRTMQQSRLPARL